MPSHVLTALPGKLQNLNGRMAKNFMELAGALNSISARAREVTELSRLSTSLASAGETERATTMLQRILADAEHVQRLGNASRESLGEILTRLQRARAPLARLVKVPSLLSTVSMLTRIEGARVQSAAEGASGIAADINSLSRSIEQHVEAVATEAAKLVETITCSQQQLSQSKRQEEQDSTDLIMRTRGLLGPLQEQAEASRAAAARIDEQYADIQRATNRIVQSIQTEDIARQQIEHVQQALRQAATALDAGDPSGCAAMLVQQHTSVVKTRELVYGSLHAVAGSLRSLGPGIQELTVQTTALASQTDRDGGSYAAAIEEGIAVVSSTCEQYSASAQAMLSTVNTIVPSVTRMTRSAKEMSRIESAIRRTALNARIETAHLGAEGGAMKAIATEVQKIAEQSEADTHAVLQELLAMDNALATMSGQSGASESSVLMSSGVGVVRRQLAPLAEAVMASSRAVSAKLTQLGETATRLHAEIQSACDVAHQGTAVCEGLDEVVRELDTEIAALGGGPQVCSTEQVQTTPGNDLSDVELF